MPTAAIARRRAALVLAALPLLLLAAWPTPAAADPLETPLPPPEGTLEFGWDVAIDGGLAVVGAREFAGAGPGGAHVYRRDASGAWRLLTTLRAPDGNTGDGFGMAVALTDDLVVVGAPGAQGNSDTLPGGAAYVFARDAAAGFPHLATLHPTRAGERNSFPNAFGIAVAAEGDVVAVGDPNAHDPEIFGDTVYVFRRDAGGPGAWGQVDRIHKPDAADRFGDALAFSDGEILVGAPNTNVDGSPSAGAVYRYGPDADGTWERTGRLVSPDPGFVNSFGGDLDTDGGVLVVGEDGDEGEREFQGAAMVYERSAGGSWQLAARLSTPEPFTLGRFGSSVAVSGAQVLIGQDELGVEGFEGPGAAYVFAQDEGGAGAWGLTAILRAADGDRGDHFGFSSALDGDTALVGAVVPGFAGDLGAAYVFDEASGFPADPQPQPVPPVAPDQAGPPTGVTAAAADRRSVTVSWTAPDDDGGAPVEDYTVRAYADGEPFASDRAFTEGPETSLRVDGLRANTTYTFTVTATTAAGVGEESAPSAAVTTGRRWPWRP